MGKGIEMIDMKEVNMLEWVETRISVLKTQMQ